MQKGANRISGVFQEIAGRRSGDSTRSYIFPEEEAKPTAQEKEQEFSLRYYVVPAFEEKDAGWEMEIAGPDAKVSVPKESIGYCIIAKKVTRGENGELILARISNPISRVYFGKEYHKAELDFRIAKMRSQISELNASVEECEVLRDAMQKNGLERLVQVKGKRTIGIKDSSVRVIPQY